MICQTCEVNAAQFHLMKYEDQESNRVVSEWFFCETDLDSFAASIPENEQSLYFVENMWS